MCAGAIINSRLSTVVYGARDPITGSCGSVIDLFSERYGHSVENTADLLNQMNRYSPGVTAEITVFRASGIGTQGSSISFTVTFGEAGADTTVNGMSVA